MKIQFVLKGLQVAGIEVEDTGNIYFIKAGEFSYYITPLSSGEATVMKISYCDDSDKMIKIIKTKEKITSRKALIADIQTQPTKSQVESIQEPPVEQLKKVNEVAPPEISLKEALIQFAMQKHNDIAKGKWFTGDTLKIEDGSEVRLDESIMPAGQYRISSVEEIFLEIMLELYYPQDDYSYSSLPVWDLVIELFFELFGSSEKEGIQIQEARTECIKTVKNRKSKERIVCKKGVRLFI